VRDPPTEVAARAHIGGMDLIGVRIDIGLRARAEKESQAVEVVFAACRTVPARSQTQVDPVHVMLRGEYRQRHQRVQLVAALAA